MGAHPTHIRPPGRPFRFRVVRRTSFSTPGTTLNNAEVPSVRAGRRRRARVPRLAEGTDTARGWSDRSAEKSLLDALIAQGLIEEDVIPDDSSYGADIITITFERIGHHLIVSDALSEVTDAAGITAELGDRLGRLIGLRSTIDLGLLEATSVVVAERFGLELTEFRTEIGDDDAIAAAVVAGTGWRNNTSITDPIRDIVVGALRRADVVSDALTMLFRLAPAAAFRADLTARPGWALLDEPQQQQVLDLGVRYVQGRSALLPADHGIGRIVQSEVAPDWAAVYMPATLARHRPAVPQSLAPDVWRSWAPAIIAAWNSGEEKDRALRSRLIDLAPQDFADGPRSSGKTAAASRLRWR